MGERDFSTTSVTPNIGGTAQHSLAQLEAYYGAEQPLAFLHPDIPLTVRARLKCLVINWPRLVVDAIDERLDVEGFRMGAGGKADAELWRIWQANDLDEGSQQVHSEALSLGRAFVMVWPDPADERTPLITVESAHQMEVTVDPATREVTEAVKTWRDGEHTYRTVYTATTISKYVDDGQGEKLREDVIDNPFGVVPVVPFVNRPRTTRPLGESEMKDVIPLADAVNKLATDMMVSAEYHAMPRRWATGVDMGGKPTDDGVAEDADAHERARERVRREWQEAAAGRVWLNESTEATFGQFVEASLDNFVKAVGLFAGLVASISGLPPQRLGIHSDQPASADAIRSSEASLVKKSRRKMRVFGGAWERVMRMALLMAKGVEIEGDAKAMETIWGNPETPTVAQSMDAAAKGVEAGILDAVAGQELVGLSTGQRADIAARDSLRPFPTAAAPPPVAPPPFSAAA